MEKSGLKMKRSALSGYTPVGSEHIGQKLALSVSSNVTDKNRVTSENGKTSYIVGLKAFAPDKAEALRELFKDREEVDIEETNGLFLTGNIWVNDGTLSTSLPMKGEEVNCIIGEVADRDAQAVIRVTNIQTPQAAKAKKFDAEAFFAENAPSVSANELATA